MQINYQDANVKNILEEISNSEIEKGYEGLSSFFSTFSLQYIKQIANLKYGEILPTLLDINKRYTKNLDRRQKIDNEIYSAIESFRKDGNLVNLLDDCKREIMEYKHWEKEEKIREDFKKMFRGLVESYEVLEKVVLPFGELTIINFWLKRNKVQRELVSEILERKQLSEVTLEDFKNEHSSYTKGGN